MQMNTITKDKFILTAKNLDNFYIGSDIALYSYAKDCDCINKVFNFMTEKKRTVGQVTEFIYDCAGRPNPQLTVVDKNSLSA